ncbi:cytochrome P450 monooxygenase pc-1 [Mycena rebaudengoi]|nr:cytochrome P450 monooxygenase pc-1 [Mycena rebaudengoi]
MMGARLIPKVSSTSFGKLDILRLLNRRGYPADGLYECLTGLSMVNIDVLWMDTIFTTHPEHIKYILATDFNNYVKGERFQHGMNSVLGSGVFNSDGEMWKFHRTITRPYFSRDRIEHFDIFDQHADAVISILKTRLRSGISVDFQDLIGRFTMDTATEFLFGHCVDSLMAPIPYPHNMAQPATVAYSTDGGTNASAQMANKFIEAFNESMLVISRREDLGHIWPLYEIFHDKTAAPMKIVSAFLDPIIHAAVEKKRATEAAFVQVGGGKQMIEGETLLDELLNSTSDVKILKDETLNILLAGRDTTMHTLTMVIYFLSMYPAVCQKLREEILAHVGPHKRPTYDDIRNMKYMRAVINESMRLYPSVPFNIRESVTSTTWPSPDPTEKPLYVPGGAKVPYSVFIMHRRTDLWGPDAEEFSPERFLDERLKKYLLNNAFQFLPFNAGPRICLGQQFAYNEMSFMLIRLLQSFSSITLDESAFSAEGLAPAEWAGAPGRKGIDRFRPKMHLTMYATDGIWVRMKEAEGL